VAVVVTPTGGGGVGGSSAGGHVGGDPSARTPMAMAEPPSPRQAPPAATEHPSTWDPNGGRAILAWAPGMGPWRLLPGDGGGGPPPLRATAPVHGQGQLGF
jgi:hypothetical protein